MSNFFDNIKDIEVHNTSVVLDNSWNNQFYITYSSNLLDVCDLTLKQFIKVFKHRLDAVSLTTEENIKYTIIEYKFNYNIVAISSSFVVRICVHNSFQTVEDVCRLLDAFDIFRYKLNIDNNFCSVLYINTLQSNDLFYKFKWNEFVGERTSECFKIFSNIIDKLTDNKFSSDDYIIYITNRYQKHKMNIKKLLQLSTTDDLFLIR